LLIWLAQFDDIYLMSIIPDRYISKTRGAGEEPAVGEVMVSSMLVIFLAKI
jgi:hypothetical protein